MDIRSRIIGRVEPLHRYLHICLVNTLAVLFAVTVVLKLLQVGSKTLCRWLKRTVIYNVLHTADVARL